MAAATGISFLGNNGMHKLEEYVCPAESAVKFKLVQKESDIEDERLSFQPEFTHQIFGENESIFGYKDLNVNIYYTAAQLTPYIGMTYSKKLDHRKFEGVEADEVMKTLAEKFSPAKFLTNLDDFVVSLSKEAAFAPHGCLTHSFTLNAENNEDHRYEVFKSDIGTPGFLKFHERLQTFILWFIDAASYIDVDDERWRFYIIYEKIQNYGKRMYAVAGYATVYHYYAYPNKIRPRISQMLILPPYQKRGLGVELLQAIYNQYIADPQVLDIAVEEPSENFVHLRDFVDATNCLKLESFQPESLRDGFSDIMAKEAQAKLKLNKRQSRRVYEILRLNCTDLSDKQDYKHYRLDVKRRLNQPFQKQQSDLAKLKKVLKADELRATMKATSKEVRLEILESQYNNLETEYRRTLERLAASRLT